MPIRLRGIKEKPKEKKKEKRHLKEVDYDKILKLLEYIVWI